MFDCNDSLNPRVYPVYSERVVNLARAYDRAVLSARASAWLLESLEMDNDPPVFETGDDSLADWAAFRNQLFRDQLCGIENVLNLLIVDESKPWFDVTCDESGRLVIPEEVKQLVESLAEATFFYNSQEDSLAKSAEFLQDNKVILFEGDGFVIPKTVPNSFVEIWWRRNWLGWPGQEDRKSQYYEMALVENPAYGWDCYGHER